MFKEFQQWRVQIVNAATTTEVKAIAATLQLDPNLTVHDVWAMADVYYKGVGYAGAWQGRAKLGFFNQGQLVAEMRVDRSDWTEFQPLRGVPIDEWSNDLNANFSRPQGLLPNSGGEQPTLRWSGGNNTGYSNVDVAPFRVRVKATEARLYVEALANFDAVAAVKFAIGARILSHKA